MSDPKPKLRWFQFQLTSGPESTGCLILFLMYPIIDLLAVWVNVVGISSYGLWAFAAALLGCICGAALGTHFSKRTTPQTYCQRHYWLIGAFAGMAIPIVLFYFFIVRTGSR